MATVAAKSGDAIPPIPHKSLAFATEVLALKHESKILDSHPSLYVVPGRAKPVLRGPNSTEPNLFRNRETTYRVG